MNLIYVKHPIDSCNVNQEKIIAESNEKDRTFHALMFNYGNATYIYNNIEPTHEEYLNWLSGLPDNIKKNFEELGFEKSKTSISLRRHANEIRDIGMDEFIKTLLTEEDYEAMSNFDPK
jgi:hypothetical protein